MLFAELPKELVKKEKLIGKTILENCQTPPPAELQDGQSWTCEFEMTAENKDGKNFNDSVVTNKVTVTATPTGQAPVTDTKSAITTIDTPPSDCPSGWPTKQGSITQGSQGPASHAKLYLPGLDGLPESAIDIGGATTYGTPAYATFTGQVTNAVNYAGDEGYGTYVDIASTCGGTYFVARWAHLKYNSIDPSITLGSTVNFGQLIGEVDDTGWSDGDHLHYSLFFLDIETYIPEVPQDLNCQVGTSIPCNVSWP